MDNNRRDFLLKATWRRFLGMSKLARGANNLDLSQNLNERLAFSSTGKSVAKLKADPIKQVRVAFIGLGNRGSGHIQQYAAMYPDKAKVVAVCDVRKENAERAAKVCADMNQKVAVYSGTLDIWKEMVKRDDIDLVVIATPWEDHATMCIEAMRQGKHAVSEVPIATTLEDMKKLVQTSEETQKHCMMLEQVNYGNEELWVLNMVRNGIFGDLTYGEAAYIHNLTELLFGTAYYNKWRIRHHVTSDGNLYPTHGLGPIAWYMDINRGDSFDYMVSMSTQQASLSYDSKKVDVSNEFYNRDDFKHGDMNNSLIKTKNGRSILVQHDVITNRPYSRINALGGTNAYHEGYPSRLSIKGKGHNWLSEADYKEFRTKYDHPIWTDLKDEIAKHGGHGGMDFVMNYRILDCLNKGLTLDEDVYDAVSWSAVFPLSVLSVELGSVPVKFPDYMSGNWKEKRALGV